MTLARPRARALSVSFIALLVVLLAVPNVVGNPHSAATGPSKGAVSLVPSAATAVYSGSFASRAGFEGGLASSITNVAPALGPELAVVSFYPSSPSFFSPPPPGAHPLTVSEIADRYGLSPSAYAAAESYFESKGLAIVHAGADRLTLTVGAPADTMGRAFGTALESGSYRGRAVSFPASAPALPANLESEVASVIGLSSGFDTFSLPSGLNAAGVALGTAVGPDLITPAIARQIYDLSSLYNVSGSPKYSVGVGIVLLLWGWGYSPSDLATFYSTYYPAAFPQPAINAYPVDGAPAPSSNAVNDPSKAPQELTLDMEWSGSMAPGASLHAVYAPDGPAADNYSPSDATITDAFHEAVTGIPGVSVISMSFGTPEGSSQSLAAGWATDIAMAAQEGITLLAATGDFGGDAAANCTGGAMPEFPSTSPGVIAVGGTAPVLSRNVFGQVTGLASEPAWSGSGGGFSSVNPAPSWQEVGSAAAPISASGYRGLPDVSATAGYNYLYYSGSDGVAAGTSFATPLWGGLVAEMDSLFGSKLGFLTPQLYAVGANQEAGTGLMGLADVQGGTTCIGTAGPGWDTESGWGSPRALNLYEDLTATFVNLTIAASPSPVAPGGTVNIAAQLLNRTNGRPIAGIPVAVSLQASDPNGPCAGVWGSSNINSNATGFVSLSVAVPACFFGAHALAEASVTTHGLYGANSTTVDVNLLGLVPAFAGIESYPQNIIAFGIIMGAAVVVGYILGRGGGSTVRPRARRPAPPVNRAPEGTVVTSQAPSGPPHISPPAPSPPPPPPPPTSGPPTT